MAEEEAISRPGTGYGVEKVKADGGAGKARHLLYVGADKRRLGGGDF